MSVGNKYFVWIILLVSVLLMPHSRLVAEEKQPLPVRPILIISSYNPETSQTARNISEFIDEYKLLNGQAPVEIENMNCKSFSEALEWRDRMAGFLEKYKGDNLPEAVIILGQEAWASYISQPEENKLDVPVLCGMVSRNAILLPDDTVDLANWQPQSIDVVDDFKDRMLFAGFLYQYDVENNLRLILDFFPETRHIAFVSDNSYGGVAMQAHVKQVMAKFPKLDLILLDGRKHTIYTIVDQIATLPENTAILVGTWRVDKNDGYFMRNATYSMMSVNPMLPAFALASVGMGHWVIGGCMPDYRTFGKDLAQQLIEMEKEGKISGKKIQIIPNTYKFDYNRLKKFGLVNFRLPDGSMVENKEPSFFEVYRYQIISVAALFVILLIGLLVTFYFYLRTKRLKDRLVISERELVGAKERAEESDRLKSAFLANMSHEIRTPLNAIVGFSNVLVSGEYSKEEQQEFVDLIQTNSALLLRLISDILDISRLETGKIKFVWEECDVTELCQKVLSTTSYSRKDGVSYVFEPAYKKYVLNTDIQRLQQILINLLGNANKFTTEGTITLDFREDEKGEFLIFSVADSGCGIPDEKLEKIFERFEKLDEYAQGTGLGLSICRLTVERLGGKIWVDRSYQKGARFVFTHPIRP